MSAMFDSDAPMMEPTQPPDPQPSAAGAAATGAAVGGGGSAVIRAVATVAVAGQAAAPPKVAKTKAKRNKPQKGNRAHRLAKFLVDTFGYHALRAGTGVVDVAGGSGDLAFQLAYMWGASPRPCAAAAHIFSTTPPPFPRRHLRNATPVR